MESENSSGTTPSQGGGSAPTTTPDAGKNTLMGILAYLGILIIIPFLVAKDEPFVKYHIKQGLVLVIIEAIVWLTRMTNIPIGLVLNLVNLAVLVLAIIGIVNVVKGLQKELPIVGKYASKFNF